jgi:membrane-associated protease RseP (regulator of RpoE activity)
MWIFVILSGMFAYWVLNLTIRRSAQISRWLRINQSPPAPSPEAQAESQAEVVLPSQEITPLRSISVAEEALLRECFPWSVYFLESIEYRPQGVVCRGRLRTEADTAYQTVKDNISERFADKFFVLFQSGLNDRPFFVLVPDIIQDKNLRPSFLNYMLASLSWTLAWGATNKYGAILSGVQPENLQQNIILEPQGWMYALAVLMVLSSKDVVKYWICRWRRISTGLIYCMPLPFFPGTCGTLLQLRAPVPDRRILFDLGFGSLLVNLIIASVTLFWGLQHSVPVSLSAKSGILNFLSCDPRFSLFLTGLSKLAMGDEFGANTAIHLHPVATAAYLGFLMMAINMLPFKRFDGGYVVHAMYGVRGSITIGQIAKIILIMLGYLQLHLTEQSGSLIFAILLMFFPTISDPTLNDVTEIDSRRDAWGMCLLAIIVLIFLPVPGILGKFWGV